MKNTLLFICRTNIVVRFLTVNMRNYLTPQNTKMCDSILVTLLKMRPHYSQPSRENATPPPLASYKEVHPPGALPFKWDLFDRSLTWCLYFFGFYNEKFDFFVNFSLASIRTVRGNLEIVSRYTTHVSDRNICHL